MTHWCLGPIMQMPRNEAAGDDDARCAAVTQLLNQASAGSRQATADLLPLVYDELRALAARKMRQERGDHTLQATALVHEAYLRLLGSADAARWDGRWHFFSAAAQAMRRILVENARQRGRLKRGGGNGAGQRVDLDAVNLTVEQPPDDVVALDEALDEFAQQHPAEAQLVQLRYFAGLTRDEAAQALGISPATASRDWAFARAWLYKRITQSEPTDAR
jgi:RNA polymerase sigma factor (TIGR02999 family)